MARCSLSKRRLPFKYWVNARAFCPEIDQNNLDLALVCLLFDLCVAWREIFVSKTSNLSLTLKTLLDRLFSTSAGHVLIKATDATLLKLMVDFPFFTLPRKKLIDARHRTCTVFFYQKRLLSQACLNFHQLLTHLDFLTTIQGESDANFNPKTGRSNYYW